MEFENWSFIIVLYPLKFATIYKEKIWGGQKIKEVLKKDPGELPNCGETWELSGVKGNISIVSNGPLKGEGLDDLIDRYGEQLVGNSIQSRFGKEFPLLIKFIDANEDLSIQVHPNDELAQLRHESFGKTEMWYVMQADDGASLISGFNQTLDKDKYLEFFKSGRLTEVLNREEVNPDDVYFLPAGRVHTIGKGLLIAEIQQTSDITYRIYDFDRVDKDGNKRELHVQESLEAIDYTYYQDYRTDYERVADQRVILVKCPYFTTNKLQLTKPFGVNLRNLDSFKIYICIEGRGSLDYKEEKVSLGLGDVILVPASISEYMIETSSGITLLESYIEE